MSVARLWQMRRNEIEVGRIYVLGHRDGHFCDEYIHHMAVNGLTEWVGMGWQCGIASQESAGFLRHAWFFKRVYAHAPHTCAQPSSAWTTCTCVFLCYFKFHKHRDTPTGTIKKKPQISDRCISGHLHCNHCDTHIGKTQWCCCSEQRSYRNPLYFGDTHQCLREKEGVSKKVRKTRWGNQAKKKERKKQALRGEERKEVLKDWWKWKRETQGKQVRKREENERGREWLYKITGFVRPEAISVYFENPRSLSQKRGPTKYSSFNVFVQELPWKLPGTTTKHKICLCT